MQRKAFEMNVFIHKALNIEVITTRGQANESCIYEGSFIGNSTFPDISVQRSLTLVSIV